MSKKRANLKTDDDSLVRKEFYEKHREFEPNERDEIFRYGLLATTDLRTHKGRLVHFAYDQYAEDLGGEDNLTMAQRELIRRASMYAMICAEIEERMLNDTEISANDYGRYVVATKVLTNLIRQIGVKRISREINAPTTLEEYLNVE